MKLNTSFLIVFLCLSEVQALTMCNTSPDTLPTNKKMLEREQAHAIKIIRAYIGIKPMSLSPNDNAGGIPSDYINQIFETLFWVDYNGNIVPRLGTSWERINPCTIQVKLRQNVKFHNGEEFNSKAVKFSFDNFLSTNNANRFYGSTIKGVDIIDSNTVNIKTTVPDSFLIYRLAIVGSILPPVYYEKVGERYFSQHPVGTGAFEFVESTDNKLVYKGNNNYWGHVPVIDQLELYSYNNIDDALADLKNGKLDFVAHAPGHYSLELCKNNLKITKELIRQSVFLSINTKKDGILRSKEFRKILQSSLNFDDVVKYGYQNNAKVTNVFAVVGEPVFDPSIKPVKLNIERAKTYIRQNNLDKYEFKMLVTKPYDLIGHMILQQMKALGLNVIVKYGDDDTEKDEILLQNTKKKIPKIDFFLSYCSHKFASGVFPHLILLPSTANWSITDDKKLDQMINIATQEFDCDKQIEKFKEIEHYVYDNALIFPGIQLQDMYVMKKKLKYIPHVNGSVWFNDCNIIN